MMKKNRFRLPVVYIEAKAKVAVKTAVEKAIGKLKSWTRIGLATTAQHTHMINEAREILSRAGKIVYVGDSDHAKSPGQVLGCDYITARSVSDEVEAFLFVGGGRFHAMGLHLATMKPTVVADPFENRAYSIQADAQKVVKRRCRAYSIQADAQKVVKRRWAEISEAREAEEFGVIIGLKPGQCNIEVARAIKQALEENGKSAALLALREITSTALLQFPTIEAYVNTACPRIALDEPSFSTKPVLTVREAYVVLGKIGWEDLLEHGFI